MNINGINLKSFTNDILDLYCKTRVSEVEGIFIKLANIEVGYFWKWLSKNNKIRISLSNSSVYDALDILSHLRSIFPYGKAINKSTLVKTIHSNAKIIPIIITMESLLNKNVINDILQPYSDIIEAVKGIFPYEEAIGEPDILSDLNMIRALYLKTGVKEEEPYPKIKESIQEKRTNMLQYLLSRFNEEVAGAANASGMNELATAIRGGILSKSPDAGLDKYIRIENFDKSKMKTCEMLADYIVKKPHYESEWGEYNYGMTKITLMRDSGNLTQEQVMKIVSDYEKSINPMSDFKKEKDGMHKGFDLQKNISIDKMLNPNYLLLLCIFFVILRSKSGQPTGFMANAIN